MGFSRGFSQGFARAVVPEPDPVYADGVGTAQGTVSGNGVGAAVGGQPFPSRSWPAFLIPGPHVYVMVVTDTLPNGKKKFVVYGYDEATNTWSPT